MATACAVHLRPGRGQGHNNGCAQAAARLTGTRPRWVAAADDRVDVIAVGTTPSPLLYRGCNAVPTECASRLRIPVQVRSQERCGCVRVVGADDGVCRHLMPSTSRQHVDVTLFPKVAPPGLAQSSPDEDDDIVTVAGVPRWCRELVVRSLAGVLDETGRPREQPLERRAQHRRDHGIRSTHDPHGARRSVATSAVSEVTSSRV